MPVHDWTRVDAGLFHAFHQGWVCALCDALNAGGLPPDDFALPELSIREPVPNTLELMGGTAAQGPHAAENELDAASVPTRAHIVRRAEERIYVRKADRVAVRHRHGQIVAVIEIVSPGNKASAGGLRAFAQKLSDLIMQSVHLLVIDLFPPSKRDPQGIHKAIWDEFVEDETFRLPVDKPLTLAAYDAGPPPVAYVEPVAVGDVLPDRPLFLKPGYYVPAPLEATYRTSWEHFPAPLKGLLESPAGS